MNSCSYISIVKEEGLEISQPALGPHSETHHQITERVNNTKVHRSSLLSTVLPQLNAVGLQLKYIQITCSCLLYIVNMGRLWSIMMTGRLTSPWEIGSVMKTVQLLHAQGKFLCINIHFVFQNIFKGVNGLRKDFHLR